MPENLRVITYIGYGGTYKVTGEDMDHVLHCRVVSCLKILQQFGVCRG